MPLVIPSCAGWALVLVVVDMLYVGLGSWGTYYCVLGACAYADSDFGPLGIDSLDMDLHCANSLVWAAQN